MAVSGPRPRGIRVRTAHGAEGEFIAAFQELCDDSTIFAPTEKMKPIGAPCAFSIELTDGAPMVRGLGTIRNAWPTEDSPFGQPGIHIEIEQLTSGTEPIFDRLLAARTAALAALAAQASPRNRPAPQTHRLWSVGGAPATEETSAVSPPPDDEPEVAELPTRITRELRAPNPPEDLTDDAVEDGATPSAAPIEIIVGASQANTAPTRPTPPPLPRVRAGTNPGFPPVTSVTPSTQIRPLVEPPVRPSQPPPSGRASAMEIDAALAASRSRPWWMSPRVAGVFGVGLGLGILVSLAIRPQRERVIVQTVPAAAQPAPAAQVAPPPVAPAAVAPTPSMADCAPLTSATAIGSCKTGSEPATGSNALTETATATQSATEPAAPTAKAEPAASTAPTPRPATTAPSAKPAASATAKTVRAAQPAPKPPKKRAGCSSLDCI